MSEAMEKQPGMLGRYQITGEIARGAMGVIYKARDPLIDRVVAIKTIALSFSPTETEAFERRFFREAKSAGRLNHPNIVTIYDVGKSGDVAYIAMEYLDGRSLREVLDSGVVLSPDKVADIGAQIAEGLAFAHAQQVIHRDVKPANIMVLHTGRVKITDFGIALLPTGTRTLTANVFGSPRYTSPEQVMGRTVDGRSDTFSLGAVIYEMLTGLPPFSADDLNGILKQVLSEPTPPPSSHNPTIPFAFDHIVGKALAKDPNDRYQDAAAMAADLRNYASIEFDTPGLAPLPKLENPTGQTRAPLLPATMPEDEALRQAEVDAAEKASARRAKLRLTLGIAGAVALVIIAFAVGLHTPTQSPAMSAQAPEASVAATTSAAPPSSPGKDAMPTVRDAATLVAASPSAPAPPSSGSAATSAAAAAPPPAAGTPPKASSAPAAASPAAATGTSAPTDAVAATKSAAPAKPTGRILVAITPWGEVHVDGRKRGLAPPLSEIRVPAGKHTVEVRNSAFPPYTETVDVPPNGDVRVKHKFP